MSFLAIVTFFLVGGGGGGMLCVTAYECSCTSVYSGISSERGLNSFSLQLPNTNGLS